MALDKLLTALETKMSAKASFQHILANTTPDLPRYMQSSVPASDPYALVTAYVESDFTRLVLDSVTIRPTTALTGDLVVTDTESGEDLFLKPLAGVIGNHCVPLNLTVPLVTAETSLALTIVPADPYGSVELRSIFPVKSTNEDILSVSGLCVFHVKASIKCDFASMVKRYADRLQWAYAYQCAALLLDEKLSSNLMNVYTNTNQADTLQRIEDYKKEMYSRIETAITLIVRDLQTAGSPLLTTTPEEQAGYFTGSYASPSKQADLGEFIQEQFRYDA